MRAAGTGLVRCIEEQLPGNAVGVRLQSGGHARVNCVFLRARVEGFKMTDLIPGCRPVMRAYLACDARTFTRGRCFAKRNVDVIIFFRTPIAVDALAVAEIRMVRFDQIRLNSDNLALAEIRKCVPVGRLLPEPGGYVVVGLEVDEHLRRESLWRGGQG